MRETMKNFMQNMDYAERRQVAKILLESIQDPNRRREEEIAQAEINKQNAGIYQKLIENYMLLVNASFVCDYERKYIKKKYVFMFGLEFPGLWSRAPTCRLLTSRAQSSPRRPVSLCSRRPTASCSPPHLPLRPPSTSSSTSGPDTPSSEALRSRV